MKKNSLLWSLTMMALLGLAQVPPGHSADEKAVPAATEEAAEGMPAMDEKMQAWMKAAAPGEQHKVLEGMAGKWTYTLRWWMAPEGKPEESTGTNDSKMIFGNRFLTQEVNGTSMGQPFEGISITGYDNVKGEYTTVWMDNMSTGMMTSSSQYDAAAKTFSEKGSMACPMTGEKNKTFRGVIKLVDDDYYTYEMYGNDESGKEFKTMEISYTRAE